MGLKIEVFAHPIASLTTGEFVTVSIVGGLLILVGAGLRAWTYTSEFTLRKNELEVRLKVLEATAGVAEKGMQTSSDIAMANADIAKAQLTAAAGATTAALDGLQRNSEVVRDGRI